jgi:hypothetical protein
MEQAMSIRETLERHDRHTQEVIERRKLGIKQAKTSEERYRLTIRLGNFVKQAKIEHDALEHRIRAQENHATMLEARVESKRWKQDRKYPPKDRSFRGPMR